MAAAAAVQLRAGILPRTAVLRQMGEVPVRAAGMPALKAARSTDSKDFIDDRMICPFDGSQLSVSVEHSGDLRPPYLREPAAHCGPVEQFLESP